MNYFNQVCNKYAAGVAFIFGTGTAADFVFSTREKATKVVEGLFIALSATVVGYTIYRELSAYQVKKLTVKENSNVAPEMEKNVTFEKKEVVEDEKKTKNLQQEDVKLQDSETPKLVWSQVEKTGVLFRAQFGGFTVNIKICNPYDEAKGSLLVRSVLSDFKTSEGVGPKIEDVCGLGPLNQLENQLRKKKIKGTLSEVAYTTAGTLKDVIPEMAHVIGPKYKEEMSEDTLTAQLSPCYTKVLSRDPEQKYVKVVFPLISTGSNNGFPKELAAKIFANTMKTYFETHEASQIKEVTLAIWDKASDCKNEFTLLVNAFKKATGIPE